MISLQSRPDFYIDGTDSWVNLVLSSSSVEIVSKNSLLSEMQLDCELEK